MSNKGELAGLGCKLVKLPLLLNGSNFLTDFSVSHMSSTTQRRWSVRLRKTATKLSFQERARKLPFSPGDPGMESRVTKKGGEVRYNR